MPLNLEPGATLRQYRIARLLGRGGMGEVYAAEDTKLGRTVAIKILPASLAHDAERLRRFTQEARTASGRRPGTSVDALHAGFDLQR